MVRITSRLVINLLLLLSTPAFANIGSITEFKGAGSIKRSATAIPAAKGSGIVKNDTVSTNSLGRFKITFVDDTTVNITENSRLVIDDFVYDGGGKAKGKLGLKVALGTVRYASGKLGHNNPGGVNIRTPTATIGVRGTDFVMTVDEIGRTMIVLLPSCFDDKDPTKNIDKCPVGAIDVTTQSGTVSMDKPFQATIVESGSVPPSTPAIVRLDVARLDNNLQVGTVQTSSGFSVIQAARQEAKEVASPAAAAADSNATPDVSTGESGAVEQVTSQVTEEPPTVTMRIEQSEPASNPDVTRIEQSIRNTVIVTEPPAPPSPPEPPSGSNTEKVTPIVERTSTVGWQYASVSSNKRHEVRVVLPKDTQVELTVIQDNVVDVYNFNGHNYPNPGLLKPEGTILIRQTSAP